MADGQGSTMVDSVAAELRTVLTEGRTLTALLALDLPAVDGLLSGAGSTRAQLPACLEQAIAALADPVYAHAASDLFPLPYVDTGWPKLAARGRDAGGRFDISYDGFRRSSEGRPSRLDEVLRQLAGALVGVLDEGGVTRVGGEPASPPVAPPGARLHRRRVMVPAAGVLLVAAISALAWRSSSSDPAPPPRGSLLVPGCDVAVGHLGPQLAGEPDAEGLQSRLAATFRNAGGREQIGCPVAPAYRWQSIAVQQLSRNGRPAGALLVAPNGVDLHFNNAAWGSYFQIGGKAGTAAQPTAGLPVRIVPYGDGHVEIEFTAGLVLVAERADAPYFWIPAVFVPWWRDHQSQAGLPTGNPLPTFRQDFQRGFVSVKPPELAVPVLTVVDRPQAELPTVETIRGRILRQPDATAWYVSTDGRRQWIPDGDTWTCLGGDANVVSRDLAGYAVATLPFGGQATCPN